MHVIGTAGHVDHGKSSLVRALTGTDPDRWREEQERGMTLDLGFAHLVLPDGTEAGIVDVPGHERFVHNMLAGAAGMELLLLVVAANEGVKPQTREHLAILDALGAPAALIVLTKRDLVDDARLAAAEADVRAAVRETFAHDAPAVAVSTSTGAGLDDLRAAIAGALRALPARPADAPVLLPVDRVFALAGHGTVVTGTLVQGSLAIGDMLTLTPPGRTVRVRALHVFGSARERVDAGARVAVQLPNVDVRETHRGATLADPAFRAQDALSVRFAAAEDAVTRLRRRTPVRVHAGAAEVLGTLVFADAPPRSRDPVDATLHVREPLVAVPGQPFVVRALSPKLLLGGGTIGAPAALSAEGDSPDVAAVVATLEGAGLSALSTADIAARANVREVRAATILDGLAADGRARALQRPSGWISEAVAAALADRVRVMLAARESASPWMMGTTSLVIARELGVEEPLLQRVLAVEAERGGVVIRAGWYATPGYRPALTPEQRAFFDRTVTVDPQQPLVPVPLETVVGALRRERINGLSQAFDTLVGTGALVKVGTDVYRGPQIETIRRRLEEAIRREGPITMARFRDAVGTTRKYAVPLMEWLDATGVTIRDGDLRRLRAR